MSRRDLLGKNIYLLLVGRQRDILATIKLILRDIFWFISKKTLNSPRAKINEYTSPCPYWLTETEL